MSDIDALEQEAKRLARDAAHSYKYSSSYGEPGYRRDHFLEADAAISRLASAARAQRVELSDEQIADAVYAVLRGHKDHRLWRALTYSNGPYDITKPSPALLDIARAVLAAARPCPGNTG